MENLNKIIGENLRRERIASGVTQKEIAEKVGYSEKSISKWESGGGVPGIETLITLSKIFNTDINALVCKKESMPYYLGIDGGGTKTHYALSDSEGNIIREHIGDCSNPIDIGIEKTKAVLKENIIKITDGINRSSVYMFAGISGGTTGNNQKILRDFFAGFGFAGAGNDSDIKSSVALGLGKGNGMIIIMGTGIAGFAVKDTIFKQIGGWGQLFDAGGGGYNLGKDALYASLKEHDGTGEKTELTAIIEERLKCTVRQNLSDIYQKGKKYIASFSDTVIKAYQNGDKVAKEIIEFNMEHAAKIINAGLEVVGEKEVDIAFNGGLVVKNPFLLDIISNYINPQYKCRFKTITEPQVNGALILARELCKDC